MERYTLITGASSGIGYELAKIFAEHKHSLIIVARNEKRLQEVGEELKSYKIMVKTITHDLSLPDAGKTLFEKIKDFPIDILVNNAGFADYNSFAESKPEAVIESIRVNVESLTCLTRLILPQLLVVQGKILNVASTAAFQPGPLMAVYYATKAYVLSFSEALRYELKSRGMTVTTLCPGATATSFQTKAHFDKSNLVKAGMMKADLVAKAAYQGLMKGKALVIPGLKNKLGVWAVRIAPRNLLLSIVYKLNKTEPES